MKKTAIVIAILAGFICASAASQAAPDEKVFERAKRLFFDGKWENAQEAFEDLLDEHPDSPLVPQATFYRATCLARRKGHEDDAIEAYKDYLSGKKKNTSLAQEAETAIIDLAYELYKDDEEDYLDEIEQRLESSARDIRYYAAFKLSLVKDKNVAIQAIPVLERIIVEESDRDLRDRARIALLRIAPASLKDIEDREEKGRAKVLKIRVMVEGRKEAEFSLNIPWALADLALTAIPEKDKAALRREGYDLDKIIRDLTRIKGNIIEIRPREDRSRVIKMWIE